VKKFISFCRLLKRCTQKKIGPFFLPHVLNHCDELNRTDLQLVDPVADAFIGHARQRHYLIGCSETRTVSAQSVRSP